MLDLDLDLYLLLPHAVLQDQLTAVRARPHPLDQYLLCLWWVQALWLPAPQGLEAGPRGAGRGSPAPGGARAQDHLHSMQSGGHVAGAWHGGQRLGLGPHAAEGPFLVHLGSRVPVDSGLRLCTAALWQLR